MPQNPIPSRARQQAVVPQNPTPSRAPQQAVGPQNPIPSRARQQAVVPQNPFPSRARQQAVGPQNPIPSRARQQAVVPQNPIPSRAPQQAVVPQNPFPSRAPQQAVGPVWHGYYVKRPYSSSATRPMHNLAANQLHGTFRTKSHMPLLTGQAGDSQCQNGSDSLPAPKHGIFHGLTEGRRRIPIRAQQRVQVSITARSFAKHCSGNRTVRLDLGASISACTDRGNSLWISLCSKKVRRLSTFTHAWLVSPKSIRFVSCSVSPHAPTSQ